MEQQTPLKVHRWQTYDYLGMVLDFLDPGKVMVQMDKYVQDLLEMSPEEFRGEANTPASLHLFKVNEDGDLLTEDKATIFHHLVAKSLFLPKRARPDIQLAVGFLCARVK